MCWFRVSIGLMVAGLMIGCGKSPEKNDAASKSPANSDSDSNSDRKPGSSKGNSANGGDGKTTWDGELKVETGDWEKLKSIVDSHRGKVVVVDVWATYCSPCVKELPHLAKLQNQYGDQVVCIAAGIELDASAEKLPEKIEKQAMKTLRDSIQTAIGSQGMLHANYLAFNATQAAETFIDQAGGTSPPTILVYGKTGERRLIDVDSVNPDGGSSNEVSYEEHVIPVVDEFLK